MIGKVALKDINRFLLFGLLVCVILYFARQVLIPVAFSIFFAMLFTSLSNRMERAGVKRVFSALISLLVIVVVTLGIGALVYSQATKLAGQLPEMEKKMQAFTNRAEDYIGQKLNIPAKQQEALVKKQLSSMSGMAGSAIKTIIGGFIGLIGSAVMVLIFTFLFLYQREKYESFFIQLCDQTPPEEAKKLIHNISRVAQSYLTGRALSVLIFTVLFTSGFLIIGLENAFLLAFIAALLTIVPYVGSIVGGLFPFAVALITEDSTSVAVGALAVIVIIQGIDNYFIEPYIIGGEVNINAFFTILILLIGGLLWGVAGMVLFLPMLAVSKIIFDAVPELNAYGYLIGDQKEKKASERLKEKIKKWFGKKK